MSLSAGELNIIKTKIKTNDLIFDVGSNVGEYIKAIFDIHKIANIHAFEPIPEIFEILKKSVNLDLVKVNNFAIFTAEEEKSFYYYTNLPGMSSLLRRRPYVEEHIIKKYPELIKVRTITLDNYCRDNNIDVIDFLKIDTEGADLYVLLSATSLLKEGRIKKVQFEYGESWSDNDLGLTLEKTFALLSKYGFKVFRVVKNGILLIPKFVPEMEDYNHMNFYAEV